MEARSRLFKTQRIMPFLVALIVLCGPGLSFADISCYVDADLDTFGTGSLILVNTTELTCDAVAGYSSNTNDCDDTDPSIYTNVDGFADADGDTWTAGGSQTFCTDGTLPAGYLSGQNGEDCNDGDNTIYPGATEIDDGIDQNCVNDAPFISGQVDLNLNTDEDTPLTLSFNDLIISDPDNTSFTLHVDGGANLTIDSDGVTILPAGDYNSDLYGDLSVVVWVSENRGGYSNDFSLSVKVNAINDVPVILSQAAIEILENTGAVYTPRTITIGDVVIDDPDGDIHTITVQDGLNYTHVGNDITPALNYNGSLSVPVIVSDGTADVGYTLTVTVTPQNSAPSIIGQSPDPLVILEDNDRTIDVGDLIIDDPDIGDSHTLLVYVNSGENYTVSGTTITPGLDYSGLLSVLVRAKDAAGAKSAPYYLQVMVSPVNDAPTFDSTPVTSATEDQVYTYNVITSDVETSDVLTISDTSIPSWLTLTATGNGTATLSGTPRNGDVGNQSIVLTVSDNGIPVEGSTQSFSITVANTNDAPTVDQGILNQSTPEDSSFTFTIPGNAFADVDNGDVLSYGATLLGGAPLPSWLSLTGAIFTGTPLNADVGIITVEVTATDNSSVAVTTTFDLEVTNTNDAPTVDQGIANQGTPEDSLLNFTIPANAFADIDVGDILSYGATQLGGAPLPSWLSLTGATFTGTPLNADVGIITVEVTATDSSSGAASVSTTFVLEVTNVNDAPTVDQGIANQSTPEDSLFQLQVPANAFIDVDSGNSLTYGFSLPGGSALPPWLSVLGDIIYGIPGNSDVGTITVEVTATDNSTEAASVSTTFDLEVTNTNDAPTVDQGIANQSTPEDSLLNLTIPADAFADIDVGDILSYGATLQGGAPLPIWLNLTGNTFSGTPGNDDLGTITIEVTATDSSPEAASVSTTFDLEVTNTNDAPTVDQGIANQSTAEDSLFTFAIPANAFVDIDVGDVLSYGATLPGGAPLPGWLTLTDATFTGTPLNFDVGTITIEVTATDSSPEAASVSTTFNLEVTNTNDAPTVDQGIANQSTPEDSLLNFTIPGNAFADLDNGDVLSYGATLPGGAPLPSWLSLTGATFTGTPLNADVGIITVEVTATDNSLEAVSTTFDLEVTNTNDAPTVDQGISNQSTPEDSLFTFTIPGNAFVDIDVGDILSYGATLQGGAPLPSWLSLTGATFTGTPLNADVGIITVQVTATDSSSGAASVSTTFVLEVTNVNDRPQITGFNYIETNEDQDRQIVVADLIINDPDNSNPTDFTVTVLSWPGNYDLIGSDTVRPLANFNSTLNGPLTVKVLVNDSFGAYSDIAQIDVIVQPIEDAPVISGQHPVNTDEDVARTIGLGDLVIDDPDFDPSLDINPVGFSLIVGAGTGYTVEADGVTITPTLNYTNTLTVPVTVNDGQLDSNEFNLLVSINPINDIPVITGQSVLTTVEETPLTVTVSDLIIDDVDNTYPTDFTVFVGDGVNYTRIGNEITPVAGYLGNLIVPVTVSDGTDISGEYLLNVDVTLSNNIPEFISTPQSVATVGSPYYYRVFVNDLDVGDTLNFTNVVLPSWLTFDAGDGRQAYVYGTPSAADIGSHSVVLEVTDGLSSPVTQSFTINVSGAAVGGLIPRDTWLISADSEEPSEPASHGGLAINAFDNVNSTFWVTQWNPVSLAHPHYLEIDLGGDYDLSQFQYLPRQDSKNGRIKQYELYVSLTPFTWDVNTPQNQWNTVPVMTGSFPNTTALQTVQFALTNGRYVRFVSKSNVTNREWAAVAEFNLVGALHDYSNSETNQAPDGWIDNPLLADNPVTIMAGDSVDFAGSTSDPDGDLVNCQWNFGDPAIPDSSGLVASGITFDTPGTYTVTMTAVDGFGATDPTPDTRTIIVQSYSNWIDKSGWQLVSVDSEETTKEDGAAINAFDGVLGSYWVTQWSPTSSTVPHEIVIALGALYDVEGFRYTPRPDGVSGGENGRIKDYELYVSIDGAVWNLVSSGTFANNGTPKEIMFTKTSAQFFKLVAKSEVNGNPWTCVVELDIFGELLGAVNIPPEATIDLPCSPGPFPNCSQSNFNILAGDSIYFAGHATDPVDGDAIVDYLWDFGGPAVPSTSNSDVPGAVRFDVPGTYNITFSAQDAAGLWDSTPDTRTVTVASDSTWLSQAGWAYWWADSQEIVGEDGAAINAFDGNPGTKWVTQWLVGSPTPPHTIDINLNGEYFIEGFRYLPRQDGQTDGNIKDFEFYVSSDGQNWGTPVATGTFNGGSAAEEVSFFGVTGQFIRLVAVNEINNNPWTAVAEINLLGKLVGAGNTPPVATIVQPSNDVGILVGESVDFQGSGSDSDSGDSISGYLWQISGPSTIVDSVAQNPTFTFDTAGDYTVSLKVFDSSNTPSQTVSRLVHVANPASNFNLISQNGWSLVSVDSEEVNRQDGAGTNAFDGDPSSIWVTQWYPSSSPMPHEIIVDLGAMYNIDGFRYLPRQDLTDILTPIVNGNILDYRFYVSVDGATWGSPVATGTFDTTSLEKEIMFTTSKLGKFVRFEAISEINGNPWTAVAELNISAALVTSSMTISPATSIVTVGDSVNFIVDQGVPPYTFSIVDNQSGGSIDGNGVYTAGAIGNVVDTIRVQDAVYATKEAVITVNENLSISPQISYVGVLGQVDFSATGGIPGYTYAIIDDQSGGSTIDAITGLYQAGSLSGGIDTIEVTDASANTSQATVGILDLPLQIDPTGMTLPANSQVYFSASGGTPPYTYSIIDPQQTGSGGTIDPVTGLYVAGTNFGVNDIIQVEDSATPKNISQTYVSVVEGWTFIDKTNWTIPFVDSEETVYENAVAEKAIDGDPLTYWATEWYTNVVAPPHEIQIDLGDIYEIDGFQYIPRQDLLTGQVEFYKFYVSIDGVNWGTPVMTGFFEDNIDMSEVVFPRTIGQFVRFVALTAVNGDDWNSVAELNIMGDVFSNNFAPTAEISSPGGNVVVAPGTAVNFVGNGTLVDGPSPIQYLWDFGDPTTDPTDTLKYLESPGNITFNTPGTYVVTFTVSDGLNRTQQDSIVVKVENSSSDTVIPQSELSLVYVDSEEVAGEDGHATNILDGNPNTYWVTSWSDTVTPKHPHFFTLDLGGLTKIDGFRYLPRVYHAGRIADYQFFVSVDGKNWGDASAVGTFPNTPYEKRVLIEPKLGRFVRFVALSEVDGNPWTSGSEFNLEGSSCGSEYIKIIDPLPEEFSQAGDVTVSAAVCAPDTADYVKFRIDGDDLTAQTIAVPGTILPDTFKATFTGITPGWHTLEAIILNNGPSGPEIVADSKNVVFGDYYVAIGDSITEGYDDDILSDNLSLDGRNSSPGFPPVLNDYLSTEMLYPQNVVNEGFSGDTTEEGLRRLPEILQRNRHAKFFLINYGANDKLSTLPSGLGTDPGATGYPHNYKSLMQQMINMITSMGADKRAYISKDIYFGDGGRAAATAEYNAVIDELIAENSILVTPPPLDQYFLHHPEHLFDPSSVHPNGLGYQAIASMWFNAIMLTGNYPEGVSDSFNVNGSQYLDVLGNDYDIDGNSIKIISVGPTSNGGIVSFTDSMVTYTPAILGIDTFTYIIEDSSGLQSAAVTVTVNVTQLNSAPYVLTPIADQGFTLGVAIADLDVSGNFTDDNLPDVLTFSDNGLPIGTGLALSGTGILSGVPTQADVDASPFTLTVTANDNNGGTVDDIFTITVSP